MRKVLSSKSSRLLHTPFGDRFHPRSLSVHPQNSYKLTRVDLLEDLEQVGVEGLLASMPPLLLLVAGGGGGLDSLGGLLGGCSLCHFETFDRSRKMNQSVRVGGDLVALERVWKPGPVEPTNVAIPGGCRRGSNFRPRL
jgi:hypothetical protein